MKKYSRVLAGILAVLLSAGCTGLYAAAQSDSSSAADSTASTTKNESDKKDTKDTKKADKSDSDTEKQAKEETVYVITDASGNKSKTVVSNWLKNPQGVKKLEDVSDLTDIENVKTDEGFIDAEGVYNSIRPTFNFPEYVNGKVVVSAKLRRRNGVQYNTAGMSFRMKSTQYTHWSIGMLIYNNADGKAVYSVSNRNYKQIPNMVLDDDGWFDFKMIVDPSVGKYMTLINGKPFTREEILFDMATPADAKYLDFMFNCDIDDFAVYNAPANMPVAGNATIQKAAVGAEATASYTYYDCLAADEGESTYQWFIADSANGVFTPIDGASGRTYIPNEADKGKYIKYTVTPKNSKGYAGSSAESEPARVIGAEIMHDFKVNSIAYDGYLAAFTEGSNNVSFIINASNHQASGTEYVTGIIAIYRSGELIDIKFDNLSLNPGVSDAIDLSCDFNIAEGETGIYRAAAFIWNNLSEMTPYGKTMIME